MITSLALAGTLCVPAQGVTGVQQKEKQNDKKSSYSVGLPPKEVNFIAFIGGAFLAACIGGKKIAKQLSQLEKEVNEEVAAELAAKVAAQRKKADEEYKLLEEISKGYALFEDNDDVADDLRKLKDLMTTLTSVDFSRSLTKRVALDEATNKMNFNDATAFFFNTIDSHLSSIQSDTIIQYIKHADNKWRDKFYCKWVETKSSICAYDWNNSYGLILRGVLAAYLLSYQENRTTGRHFFNAVFSLSGSLTKSDDTGLFGGKGYFLHTSYWWFNHFSKPSVGFSLATLRVLLKKSNCMSLQEKLESLKSYMADVYGSKNVTL